MLELRRRVLADPASIAFAQLAEECRRAGDADEAIGICRAGLACHPSYLSARVTLGRALIEMGRFDEAAVELSAVAEQAPTNLAAIRGLAEVHQQRGDRAQALTHYQRALKVAHVDPDLEDSIEHLSQGVQPPTAPTQTDSPQAEELFDFDALLEQLGAPASAPERPSGKTSPRVTNPDLTKLAGPGAFAAVDLDSHRNDAFADVERELRERVAQRDAAARLDLAQRRQAATTAALEAWLAAILADRHSRNLA